jgi:hypothetical protein
MHSNLLLGPAVERMRERRPDMQVAEVPDVGHAPSLAEWQAERAIDRFLAGIGG